MVEFTSFLHFQVIQRLNQSINFEKMLLTIQVTLIFNNFQGFEKKKTKEEISWKKS